MRHIQRVLYNLSRKFATQLTIVRQQSHNTNYKTGEQLDEVTEIIVKRAILLPKGASIDFVYDLSYIAANKNFVLGAEFLKNSRVIAIAPQYLPPTFTGFLPTDTITIATINYIIKDWTMFAENDGWALIIEQVKGYS